MAWVVPVATAAVGAGVSLYNAAKARKLAKEQMQSRPKDEIPADANRELSLSESELGSGGLSARAQSAYSQLNNRQFSSSLDATLRAGGSPNLVSDVFDTSQAGRMRLAQLNDEIRLNQINNLISSRRYMNEQKDKQFEFNEWMPWADSAQATGQARKDAVNGVWSAVNTGVSSYMNYRTQQQQQQMWQKYLDSLQGGGGTSMVPPPAYGGGYGGGNYGGGSGGGPTIDEYNLYNNG